jgi:hypothetical protein
MIAHPGQRQIGEHHVIVGQSVKSDGIRRGINAASRRQRDALRCAGRSRSVEDDRDVGTVALTDEFIDLFTKCRVGRKRRAAVFDDVADSDQPTVIVVVKAARLVIDNRVEMRQSVRYRQDFVDLLLILRCDKLCLGVSENKSKLVSHCIRINWNRNRAQRMRCHDGPIELWPIGTDDRDRVS